MHFRNHFKVDAIKPGPARIIFLSCYDQTSNKKQFKGGRVFFWLMIGGDTISYAKEGMVAGVCHWYSSHLGGTGSKDQTGRREPGYENPKDPTPVDPFPPARPHLLTFL